LNIGRKEIRCQEGGRGEPADLADPAANRLTAALERNLRAESYSPEEARELVEIAAA
jgi:hypothetical protein